MRGTPITILLVLVTALIGETTAFSALGQRGRQLALEPLEIRKEPHPADWRYFLKSSETERERLWTYHQNRGVHLGGWSWGWRLGWVRACGASDRRMCQAIMREALFDRALVVRAEAATRIGRRYEGTGSLEIIETLAKAYADPRNVRHGKPLFAQSRILFALRMVGGMQALAKGASLAASHPESQSYWARLDAAEGK